ncbi:hypothetical protein [Spongiimicrobium salis]|uniref:hypothetical protein n=1 Tax=Spongiimicrobium salis TaxID=1667022 RepID=UPI00374CC30A
MNELDKHTLIIKKFGELYGNLRSLKTNNVVLHTRVFTNPKDYSPFRQIILEDSELPIIECRLPNENYLLATTKSMYSWYQGNEYEMLFSDFKDSDRAYFSNNIQLAEGKTRVFRYELKNGKEFIYEVDSFYPADIVHNRLVLSINYGRYDD